MRATHRGQVRSSAGGEQAVERLFEHCALPDHHPFTAKGLTKATTGDQVVIQRHLLQVACIGVGAIVGCAEAVIRTALAEWCVKWAAPPAPKGLNPALNA